MIKSANLTASVSRQAGGLFDAVMRLAQSHDRQKFDECAFGLWDESVETDLAAWAPVPVTAFKTAGPLKVIGYAPGLAAALENFAPDVCHTHGLWLYPSVVAKNYSRQNRRPYLVSPHGMLDPWALKNSRWKKRIAWALFEHAHLREARCLRALCKSEADSIRQLGLGNEIVIIPNGIDLPTESPASPAPWASQVESGKKVLLYLSRIHPKKGLVNLLKAWSKTQNSKLKIQTSERWILAIAGWDQGGHETELKQLCAELKISFADIREPATRNPQPATVLFLGPQFNAAKSACYHHCDAFVLPSFSEGLPMVVLEAWANAKPVVMTAECNLPEGFQAGAALKIEPTENSVTAGLNELFQMSEAERVAMGGRGRELVVARFTWPRIAQQIEEVYAWMLGGGAKPDCISGAC